MRSKKTEVKRKSNAKKIEPNKSVATQVLMEKKLRGAKADAVGLRYEQTVANYFASKGWSPRNRVSKYGYEYDLYAKKSGMLIDEYLVVECKCKGKVSAKDVVHFIKKVDVLYKNLPVIILDKPPLYAYLCYSEEVDKDASDVARSHKPSVKLLKIDKKGKVV